jgi:hypothetical protein
VERTGYGNGGDLRVSARNAYKRRSNGFVALSNINRKIQGLIQESISSPENCPVRPVGKNGYAPKASA